MSDIAGPFRYFNIPNCFGVLMVIASVNLVDEILSSKNHLLC